MDFRAAAVFSNHMVLQRDTPIPIWGRAKPTMEVRCFLSGNRWGDGSIARTHANDQGHWELRLPTLSAGGPYTLTLRCGKRKQIFSDVFVGDVWLAGGQSNMELALIDSKDGDLAVSACNDPRLHFYETPKVTTPEQAEQAQSGWQVLSPETAARVSAVAYYAAREIAREQNVHVGILECFWGGTFAHCWMPRRLLKQFPEGQQRISWYDAQIGDKTDEEFDAQCREYQSQVDAWNQRIADRRAIDPEVSWAILNEECGLFPWPPLQAEPLISGPAICMRVCSGRSAPMPSGASGTIRAVRMSSGPRTTKHYFAIWYADGGQIGTTQRESCHFCLCSCLCMIRNFREAGLSSGPLRVRLLIRNPMRGWWCLPTAENATTSIPPTS